MNTAREWGLIIGAALVLAGAAGVGARWLRAARLPGGPASAGVVAGLIVGVILGATVLGRVAPEVYRRAFLGATAERAALRDLQSRHALETAALRKIGVSAAALAEQREAHAEEAAPVRAALASAASRRARRWAMLLAGLAGGWLALGALGSCRPSRRAEPARGALVAALGSTLFSGGPAFLFVRWFTDAGVTTAAAFACSVAVGAVVFGAPVRVGGRAGRPRDMDRAAALALALPASTLAVIIPTPATITLAAGALGAGIILLRVRAPRRLRRIARGVASGTLLPGAVAVAAAHADFIAMAPVGAFWVALVIAGVLSADGRWLGGWAGWNAAGNPEQRRTAWARSAVMLTAGVGAAQIALAGVADLVGVAPAPIYAAVLLAAPMVALSAPLRARLARALDTGARVSAD